jgi:hypothetical protein
VSVPASSFGTIAAKFMPRTLRNARLGAVIVIATVFGSITLRPLASLTLPSRTLSAPAIWAKNAAPTGDGVGVRLGSSTRLSE